jgi:23S rRNA (cytosine1962-C5)-methyltransferase
LTTPLIESLREAMARRGDLSRALMVEGTNAYRLFHGIAEGRPGLTIDRYGAHALIQTWREPLSSEELNELETELHWPVVWRHRGQERVGSTTWVEPTPFTELGVRYEAPLVHRGQDPWLFLDLRAGRRWIQANAAGKRVLNLFSYTGASGLVAATAGAAEVLNIDHGGWPLKAAQDLAKLNGVEVETLKSDHFVAVRQLAGLKIRGRAKRRGFVKMDARRFDLVVLDPPTFTKGPFGAVDIIRDYAGLLKPALLCLAKGGTLLATNHSSRVELEDWKDQLERCASKAERPLSSLRFFGPEADFPSTDGKPPLKIAVMTI